MIVTVTMNPSIDISCPLPVLAINKVNRPVSVYKTAGGKGLNVTRVLSELNADVLATGVLGGHHGAFIQQRLDEEGIHHRFSPIKEETRNSIAILHEGNQTEILEPGPLVSSAEQDAFLVLFKELLESADIVTISGSLARGFSADFYQILLKMAHHANVRVLLDASGENLKNSLAGQYKPFLIKPNMDEIQELINEPLYLDNLDKLKQGLSASVFDDIDWVVVSLGADGALVKYNDKFYRLRIPKINAVNPVGSGDATLAGLAYGLSQGDSPQNVMKTAMTTGILNTLEEKTGHINPDNFDDIFSQITVEEI